MYMYSILTYCCHLYSSKHCCLTNLRPITLTLGLSHLYLSTSHYHNLYELYNIEGEERRWTHFNLMIPKHPPEVIKSVWERTLSSNVADIAIRTLRERGREGEGEGEGEGERGGEGGGGKRQY